MSDGTKIPFTVANTIALALVDEIRPFCRRVEIAGSLRRQSPAVGDVEIVAMPWRPVDLFGEERAEGPTELDRYLDSRDDLSFTSRGAKYQRINVMLPTPELPIVTVDLFLPTILTWGSIFTIRTGSWEFSRWLVTPQASGGGAPGGIMFREGLIYKDGRPLSTPEESDVFAALGLVYIPPNERTGVPVDPVRVDPIWQYAD